MRRAAPAFIAALLAAAAASGHAQTDVKTLPQWFIFLETGKPTPPDKATVDAMQRGHIDNFKRLFAIDLLTGAGPMRDPARLKRGIVIVRARSADELQGLFQPDDYVREGYMRLNAVAATVQRPLQTEGIDAKRVAEGRIVQIGRAVPANAAGEAAQSACLQSLVARGVFGAWYTLASGPIAEVLFAASTDTPALLGALAACPGLPSVSVWAQWLSPGVVKHLDVPR